MTVETHLGRGGVDVEVSLTALWGSLRLAVLDVETCNAADGDHVIDLAVLTYRAQRLVGTWSRRFNPGVPVDGDSQRVHGLTDAELARERPFTNAVAELTAVLTPTDGERLVLVAHNAAFDVSRLQLEFGRAVASLPNVAVLDTQALARHVGLHAGSLADLLTALDLTNAAPHTAAGDAEATGRAALVLLRKAAAAGANDLDDLLAAAMGGRRTTTSAIKAAGRSRRRHDHHAGRSGVELPDAHILGHAELLPDRPTADQLATWLARVSDCVRLRCPYLADRVAETTFSHDEILPVLETALDAALTQVTPRVSPHCSTRCFPCWPPCRAGQRRSPGTAGGRRAWTWRVAARAMTSAQGVGTGDRARSTPGTSRSPEIVPTFVEFEVAVPRLTPAVR